MVKIQVTNLDEAEVRGLFESVAQNTEDITIAQSKAQCKLQLPLRRINQESFRSTTAMVTLTYTKNTAAIQLQTAAAHSDSAETKFKEILEAYTAYVRSGTVAPLPPGSQMWAQAFYGDHQSDYLASQGTGAEGGTTFYSSTTEATPATHVPPDEHYHDAVNHLLAETQMSSFISGQHSRKS